MLMGDYGRSSMVISPKYDGIDDKSFKVVDAVSLVLPDDVADIKGLPMLCFGRIYVRDSKYESVLVFDAKGRYMHRVGRLGHARDEVIGRIESFDVDVKNGDVHVFNREGAKMLVYDSKGICKRCVRFSDMLPSSVCLTDGGYIASYDYRSSSDGCTRLLLLDRECRPVKSFFVDASVNNMTCEGSNTSPLFSDHHGNVTYLSLLADSLVVITGDTVKCVLDLNFDEGFLPASVIDKVKRVGDTSLLRGNPVQFVSKAMINGFFVLVEYYGGEYTSNHTCLFDRRNEKYYFKNGFLFMPRVPGCITTISGDCLVGVVTVEDIDNVKRDLDMEMAQRCDGEEMTEKEILGMRYNPTGVKMVMRKKPCPFIYKVKAK